VHGSYDNKQPFENSLFKLEVFNEGRVVLEDYHNFTLNRLEVWGKSARVDIHAEYFLHQPETDGLIDVEPSTIKPIIPHFYR
jgi:hypothetical protein